MRRVGFRYYLKVSGREGKRERKGERVGRFIDTTYSETQVVTQPHQSFGLSCQGPGGCHERKHLELETGGGEEVTVMGIKSLFSRPSILCHSYDINIHRT